MSAYGRYPIAQSIASAIWFEPGTSETGAVASQLHSIGICSLNQLGLAYYTESGRAHLQSLLSPMHFQFAKEHAQTRTFVPGLSIAVVWKDDDEGGAEAAWMCIVEKELSGRGEYEVRCTSDNARYEISTFIDDISVHPQMHGIDPSFLTPSICDVEGNVYTGNFNALGQPHGANIVVTPKGASQSITCTYQNGIFVSKA